MFLIRTEDSLFRGRDERESLWLSSVPVYPGNDTIDPFRCCRECWMNSVKSLTIDITAVVEIVLTCTVSYDSHH